MSRRAHPERRCDVCHQHKVLCLCGELPRLHSVVHLVLVMHHEETQKPTNTGRLAPLCLPECSSVYVVGDRDHPSPAQFIPDGHRGLMLMPGDDAIALSSTTVPTKAPDDVVVGDISGDLRPVALVVPDGTWRQARRIRNRHPELLALDTVTLPDDVAPTRYQLRNEPVDGGMATLEAIAHAYRALEGNDVVADALLDILHKQVDRTLWLRGRRQSHEVYGGLPAAARDGRARGAHGARDVDAALSGDVESEQF